LQTLQMHTGNMCYVSSGAHGLGKLVRRRQSVHDMLVTSPATNRQWQQTSSKDNMPGNAAED